MQSADEKFLKGLLSKRKESGTRSLRYSWLDITPADRERLYDIGKRSGLLTRYEFSGITSSGISRNDAARMLLHITRKRAFEKLRTEFGAKAHFWANPQQFGFLGIDFYWRLAKLAVVITGPLRDNLKRAGQTRTRDSWIGFQGDDLCKLSPNTTDLAVLTFPYYVVWHHPSDFIAEIREKLVASGCYPRLVEHT